MKNVVTALEREWESLAMVERYTRSVRFEDGLKLYPVIVEKEKDIMLL